MDDLTREALRSLAKHEAPGSVSIVMPTHTGGPDTREDPIRFRNLLRESEERFAETGGRRPDIRRRLEPLARLVDDAEFWEHQGLGLAVFVDDDEPRTFRLPVGVEAVAVVGPRFYVKPLIPALAEGEQFYVLALSQHGVRLLDATPRHVREVDLPPDTPNSVRDLAQYEAPERSLQFHTEVPAAHGEERGAMFHGHGGASDEALEKKRAREFCEAVHRGVMRRLNGREAPLILAAADPLIGIYRDINKYPHLADDVIRGNPDRVSAETLRDRAAEALRPRFRESLERDAERYHRAVELAEGDRASGDLETVALAALDARVDTLWVATDEQVWGRLDPEARRIERHDRREADDEELLNAAGVLALRSGATVHAMPRGEMPAAGPVAATFRFPAP
jgi:hypothetical protein